MSRNLSVVMHTHSTFSRLAVARYVVSPLSLACRARRCWNTKGCKANRDVANIWGGLAKIGKDPIFPDPEERW